MFVLGACHIKNKNKNYLYRKVKVYPLREECVSLNLSSMPSHYTICLSSRFKLEYAKILQSYGEHI